MYRYILKKFEELSTRELYQILQLRNEVFIIEQNCLFQDLDGKDFMSHHLLIYKEDYLAAYSRIFPEGIMYKESSIGRVVTSPKVRSSGIGKILMEKSIQALYDIYGEQPIRIGAQCYAVPFYQKLGFQSDGEIYLEDDIEHIEMIKK